MESILIFQGQNGIIKYIPELNAPVVEFDGLINHQDYKFVMEKAHDLILERHLNYWIGDLTNMKVILPENQQWTNEYFIPKVLSTSTIKKVAIIVGKDVFTHASMNKIREEVERSNLPIRYLDNFNDIKSWFNEEEITSHRVSA